MKINELTGMAEMILDNTLTEQTLMDALAVQNFDREKINVGVAILKKTTDSIFALKIAETNSRQLTMTLKKQRNKTQVEYLHILQNTRMVCKGKQALIEALNLNEKRKRYSFYDWAAQAKNFFTAVLAEETVLNALAEMGTLETNLQETLQMLERTVDLKKAKHLAAGQVQALRVERNRALDQLRDWLRKFIHLLRYVTKENPQQLEKLGIQVHTEAYKARKRALAKAEKNNDDTPSSA